MTREFLHIGGPAHGERIWVEETHSAHKIGVRLPPENDASFDANDGYKKIVAEAVIYTKRQCWTGHKGRDFYFAISTMSDDDALGKYLEIK